jgi:glucose-1-phosphate adenylyltransferase
MDILCQARPKPALPFAGRFKVIDFSLSNCVYFGIDDIAVLTDYQRSHLADYLEQWSLANAKSTGLRTLEPGNGSYEGTADAVYQSLGYLAERGVERVLILAGDHVYKLNYNGMLAFHQRVNADVTVAVTPVPIEQAHRFGTVNLATDGRILGFQEKSPAPQSNLASMGIYVFNKDILAERLTEDASDRGSQHDFGYSILPRMVKQDRVFAYMFDGYWQDIGTVGAYYEANLELIRVQPSFSLDGKFPVLTFEPRLLPSRLDKQANIRNSLVSPGCVIRGRVENSILSPGVWVGEEAVVRGSVIMGGVSIARHSLVDHCVLDEGVNIGEFCNIGDGCITVLGKGVAIPPKTSVDGNYGQSPQIVTFGQQGRRRLEHARREAYCHSG